MDRLTISAASGMRARMESLDMLANNIANASAAGYKVDREFYGLYTAPEALEGSTAGGLGASALPVIERQWTDFSQGTLTPTGGALDLALSGKGFFSVNGPAGPLYTRQGSFRLTTKGVLETQAGYPVRAVGGRQIEADPARPLDISADGVVRQQGQEIGRLELVDVPDPAALAKRGALYFQLSSRDASAVKPASAEVYQGKLESSNVGPAESAVRLVNVLRQFEMLQRALVLAGEMNRRGVDEVARVSQ